MGTFKQLSTTQTFVGLSTETKPTSGVNYGARFYEVNSVSFKVDKIFRYVPDSDGAGTSGWVQSYEDTNDANLQVNHAAVSNANPVPISDAGSSITIDQSTHDSLCANANLQVGDADVSATNPVPVYQATQDRTITATVTRPANTTAYALGDVISDSDAAPTILTFADVVSDVGGTGFITGATMISTDTTVAGVRLMLFHGSAPTAINDNAAFAPSDAEAANCIGWFDFTSYQTSSNNLIYFDSAKLVQFKCGAALTDIYAIPVVVNAFTPTSGATYTFNLAVSNGITPFNSNSIKTVSGTITRPADTNAYVTNDVVSDDTATPTILTFADAVVDNGGKGQIIGGTMTIDAASTPNIRLLLFHGAAPTAINDNATFAPSDADAAKCIGWLDFDTYQAGSGNTVYQDFSKLLQFECGAAVNDIYGIPVVQSGYTPVSGANYTFSLSIMRS